VTDPRAPAPRDRQHRRFRAAVSSLSIPAYRRFFWCQLVSQSGNALQIVAQAWLVLQITGSGTQLGGVTAAQFVPLLLLGPLGGVIADRWERRRILLCTQLLLALVAVGFAVVTGLQTPRLIEVYILATCSGVVTAFDNPAKQSIISDLVPLTELRSAVTLNSIELNVARVLGPGVGGLLIAFTGVSVCFAINAVSFAGVLWAMFTIRTRPGGTDRVYTPMARGVLDGLRYVRGSPQLSVPLLAVATIGMLAWEFPVTLPLLAAQDFDGNPKAYGVMVAVMGAGAVVGGLITSGQRTDRFPNLPLACAGWGVPLLCTAVAPAFPLTLVCLLFVGYASVNFNALSKSTLQLGATPDMRGRVMALWAIAWQGSTPVGGPIIGWIGTDASARWALATGGFAALAVGLVTIRAWRRVRQDGLLVMPGASDVDSAEDSPAPA
jgi:MFS family permease